MSSDYSFIIQSIDRNIAASLPQAETPGQKRLGETSLSTIAANTSAKRRRVSELIMESDAEDHTSGSNDFRGLGSSLRLQMQLDELKLKNEQLTEHLQNYRSEHELFKDNSARQLKFLEDTNIRYKYDLDAARQKYFDEKKKWQTKIREMESTLKKTQADLSDISSSHERAVPRQDSVSNKAVEERIHELEAILIQTQEQSAYSTSCKLELERRVFELEQEKIILTAYSNTTGDEEDRALELRQLRKQVFELETIARRKTKEVEKLSHSVKNQTMLEEELASSQTRLKLAQETIKAYQNMEIEHRLLLEERQTWNTVFHQASTTSNMSASKSIEIVQNMQQTCLTQQTQLGESTLTISNLQHTITQLQHNLQDAEAVKNDLSLRLEKLESRQTLQTQQSRLYERELTSLRTLLHSYDLEFSIGKPDLTKILFTKDTVIDGLRVDLDMCRKECLTLNSQLQTTLQTQHETQQIHAQGSAEVQVLKQQNASLKDDLSAMQEITGLDYLPHKTKIFHLIDNPSSDYFSVEDKSKSTMPGDVIARLVKENQEMKMTAATSSAADASNTAAGAAHSALQQQQDNSGDENDNMYLSPDTSSMIMIPPQQLQQMTKAQQQQQVDQFKLNERLKQMFKEKISTFREAVYRLTGYKMEMSSVDNNSADSAHTTRLKLKPMYAEDPDDYLLFHLTENGPVLLETDLMNRLDDSLIEHLKRYDSMPAFLANVTLTLFENSTMM